ncbi:Heterochromatin protein 1-binding protein 3 [Tupaia chinensis]|uniref:Heterochromatin protein 1-binding protein 3 n=1 Tax=Tupaia chinensis TaxID=246437 RepID=L9L009_TUPCH|nr:Heterochromatin protein 1-binding protein 3 [Tupaia chinensis]
MPIRRAVNSTRETPPKSKLAEGEEEKPEPDISSEESVSTVEEQENETPPATSSETEQPKGEPENEEKEENKLSEETKKEPQLLKNALQRAVERGQLEQITGKGASGTFQLKKSGEKPLLGGSLMEYAILSAIAAMNEPKTCSTTALKKYVLENHPGTNSNYQMHLLKKTLQKCEKNGWMEQISGKGFSGTFQLCFPYYPRLQKKTPAKSPGKAASMKQRGSKPTHKVPTAQRGKARPLPKKTPPKAKTPAKKARPSPSGIKKPSGGSSKKPAASARKEVKLPGKGKSTMKKSFKAKK